MPSQHAIFLTNGSIAFFPGCGPCFFAKIKFRSLGGMKGTTPLNMIPLCMVSASPWWSNPFNWNIVSNCWIWFVSLCPGRVCLFQVQFWFLIGSPKHFKRGRCYWLRSPLDRCQINLRQNPFCSKHLHEMPALLVCTSTHNWSPLELSHILWF